MKKIFKFLIPVLALLSAGMFTTGCTDNDTGADYINEFYTIERAEWSYNPRYERWEVFFRNYNIDEYMIDNGVSNGYMWFYEYDDNGARTEVRRQLPEITTIWAGDNYFDVVYDYDLSLDYIGFFIRTVETDYSGVLPKNYIPATMDFKVSLFWRR